MLELYKNIRERRILLGMSQEELAKKVGYTNRSMIARIERGDIDLSQTKILEFAKALKTTAGELMGDDGTEEPQPLGENFEALVIALISREDIRELVNIARKSGADDVARVTDILKRFAR